MRPDRDEADWFKPLHVRDASGARDRISAQVAAGADVVVAPTWQTHRRALLPLAETRRAADWSAAAVRVAREAVELGLEARAAALADAPDDDIRRGRPMPLVAASLPALDEGAEQEHGQLLPREAATERDYRDHAGTLADAGPDLLLVEGQHEEGEARVAMLEAVDTGLPVWVALGAQSLAGVALEEWLDRARSLGVERLLLPGPLDARGAAMDGGLAWGGIGLRAELVGDWLAAGADVVGRLDGATVESLEPLRRAIDDQEEALHAAARAASGRWDTLVTRAAGMAPGGAAAWIGKPPVGPLPSGFEWLRVDAHEAGQLPSGHYRLVVAADPLPEMARLLERGGVLVQPLSDGSYARVDLRLVVLDDAEEPAFAIFRRED